MSKQRFKTIPIEVEAEQFNPSEGGPHQFTLPPGIHAGRKHGLKLPESGRDYSKPGYVFVVTTPVGPQEVKPLDWIIYMPNDNTFRICPKAMFEQQFVPVHAIAAVEEFTGGIV